MFVKERFKLSPYAISLINDLQPDFGYDGFGEFIFYRTYSRWNGEKQESWHDCVIRVIEGCMSIRKDWYIKNHISWVEKFWQEYALKMAISLFKMEWLAPGRGLWAMGTDFIYERGSMALNNCGVTELGEDFENDLGWLMDALMLGVGVGFSPTRNDKLRFSPRHEGTYDFEIPDSREGWVESVVRLISAMRYGTKRPRMIYDKVRPAGLLIRGFGGISSGPNPLMYLHEKIEELCILYMDDPYYDSVMLKMDIANLIGCCVVAGNVRRSAELASLSIKDPVFKNLKNYEDPRYAYRAEWGWMSNNATDLEDDTDFEHLGEIAESVKIRGEPGYKNLQNFPYGRIGKSVPVRLDKGKYLNPCGESILENKELCNQSETLPTRCDSPETWLKACEYATTFSSTISLLPTHQPETNKVIARNRRITVSIIDYTGWKLEHGVNKVTKWMRVGYDTVTRVNQWANSEAGVPESIRKTTIKPGGTTPKLAGRTPGIGHPTFTHTLRRVIIAKNSPLIPLLKEANVPLEQKVNDPGSLIVQWPIIQGPAKPAYEISLWEQAMNLVLVQREWADNAVSNTLYFRPKWVLIGLYQDTKTLTDFLSEKVDLYKVLAKIDSENEDFQVDKYRVKTRYDEESGAVVEISLFIFDRNHEEDSIEPVLSAIAPLTKSVSLLPHSPKGVYEQMPEEGISEQEYWIRKQSMRKIDWSKLTGSSGEDERYCQGANCEITTK